jgi:phosphate starvation-inducible protein PhoH
LAAQIVRYHRTKYISGTQCSSEKVRYQKTNSVANIFGCQHNHKRALRKKLAAHIVRYHRTKYMSGTQYSTENVRYHKTNSVANKNIRGLSGKNWQLSFSRIMSYTFYHHQIVPGHLYSTLYICQIFAPNSY